MSCCPVPSVCFSLTFQSRSQPLSFLTPPGYLQPPFYPPFLIPAYMAVNGTVLERGKKECKNSRERERRGEKQPCIKLFFKWWWSEQRSRLKGGGTNSVRGPREAGSQLSWPPHSPLSLVVVPSSFINGSLSARHGWPFLPAAFEATMTAVITMYVKTRHADLTPKVFGGMMAGM